MIIQIFKQIKGVSGLISLAILSSCGNPLPSRSTIASDPTAYSNETVALEKKSPFCRSTAFAPSATNLTLHLFLNGSLTTKEMDFSPLLKNIFIKDGTVISETHFNERTEYIQDGKKFRIVEHTKPQDVFLCPGESYERNTIESAALNTSYYIKKTYDQFKRVAPDIPISPVTLSIAPSIILSRYLDDENGKVKKEGHYMTDNALYLPNNQTIAFLPHSTAKNSSFQANLWEVPMVSSHEYGHHLFQMIYQEELNHLPGVKSCFGIINMDRPSDSKLPLTRKITIKDVLTAYNEGFSDLVAYYALDSEEKSVEGVKCLEYSRDVGSSIFLGGKLKIFNKEALHSFFYTKSEPAKTDCTEVSYQDPHAIGAIFAYSANDFLGLMTNSVDEKLAALVEWVKFLRLEKNKYRYSRPEVFFKKTFSEFLRMSAKRFNRSFDETLCHKIEEVFPDLNMEECFI